MNSLRRSNTHLDLVKYYQLVNKYLVNIENIVSEIGDHNGNFQRLTYILKRESGIPTNNGKEINHRGNLRRMSQGEQLNVSEFERLYKNLYSDLLNNNQNSDLIEVLDKEFGSVNNMTHHKIFHRKKDDHFTGGKIKLNNNDLLPKLQKFEDLYQEKDYLKFLKVSSEILETSEQLYSNISNNNKFINKSKKEKFINNIKLTYDIINQITEMNRSKYNKLVKDGSLNEFYQVINDLVRSIYVPLFTFKKNINAENKQELINESLNNSSIYIQQITGNN